MHLYDLFDIHELERAIDDKLVKVRLHPTLPYNLLCYAEKVQYTDAWTQVTTLARGLTFHRDTLEITARPFPKFFNYGTARAPKLPESGLLVTDKMDGALIIVTQTPNGPLWHTKGSFMSDAAVRAAEIVRDNYRDVTLTPGWTYMFELISPWSKVVLEYPYEDLVFLAANNTATGAPIEHHMARATWPGPAAEIAQFDTLAEAAATLSRTNAEGWVVMDQGTGERVKVKQEDYKHLHGVATGLEFRHVWAQMAVDDTRDEDVKVVARMLHMSVDKVESLRELSIGDLVETIPDEMFTHFDEAVYGIERDWENWMAIRQAEWAALDKSGSKKDLAARIKKLPKSVQSEMFSLASGRSIALAGWRAVMPEAKLPVTPWRRGYDAAIDGASNLGEAS